MASTDMTDGNIDVTACELPAQGYPIAEQAVEHWFRGRYHRAPTEQEIGAIIGRMARREATPPHRGPEAASQGWVTGPQAPVTRR
jgi:hypothetical protein